MTGLTVRRWSPWNSVSTPLRWRKPAWIEIGTDLFSGELPDDAIAQVWGIMAAAGRHVFQVTTSSPKRMRNLLVNEDFQTQAAEHYLSVTDADEVKDAGDPFPLPNVILGVTAQNQAESLARIPLLLATPATGRFLDARPLLGPIRLCRCDGSSYGVKRRSFRVNSACPLHGETGLDWVVTGGEAGKSARATHPEWVRGLRDQCRAAGVPFLFTQWGLWGPAPWKLERLPEETDTDYIRRSRDLAATHSLPVWAADYPGMKPKAGSPAWGLERGDSLDNHQASLRQWGKKVAGREIDGQIWDQYPTVEFRGLLAGSGTRN